MRSQNRKNPQRIATSLTLVFLLSAYSIQLTKRHINAPVYQYSSEELTNVPEFLDWGYHLDVKNPTSGHYVNYLSTIKNQHLPQYCGSCWAQATASTMTDRLNILRNTAGAEWTVSAQMLLTCSKNPANNLNGCEGADTYEAALFLEESPIFDSSCLAYQAIDLDGMCADKDKICQNIVEGEVVFTPASEMRQFKVKKGTVRKVTEYYNNMKPDPKVNKQQVIKMNEKRMIAELQNGPIVCGVSLPKDFPFFQGSQIFQNNQNLPYDHDVSIVGYGTENGVPYWNIRNSWGEPFGDEGFFRLERGKGIMNIEFICVAFTPETIEPSRSALRESPQRGVLKASKTHIDRRTLHGETVLPWVMSQNGFGMYCDSSYAIAATTVLATRYNMISKHKKIAGPQSHLTLSVQQVLDCGIGSCKQGGSPIQVFKFFDDHYSVAQGCNIYRGESPKYGKAVCNDYQNCATCFTQAYKSHNSQFSTTTNTSKKSSSTIFSSNKTKSKKSQKRILQIPNNPSTKSLNKISRDNGYGFVSWCFAIIPENRIKTYKRYTMNDYGVVSGVEEMIKEIGSYGPIACGIQATKYFQQYKGGIFSETLFLPKLDHWVTLTGFETDESTGLMYWIGLNSWGTGWGEEGFFRVPIGENVLGIESMCYWGNLKYL